MRAAFNDKEIVYDEDTFVGLMLGYDYCAEHEWGIKGIRQAFGMNEKGLGIKSRQITKSPVMMRGEFTNRGKKLYYITSNVCSWCPEDELEKKTIESLKFSLNLFGDHEFYSAWDENHFGFAVKEKSLIDQLWEAFEKNDVAIFSMGSNNPFGGSGLAVFIVSRLPKNFTDRMKEADEDRIRLHEAAEKTGIRQKIDARNVKIKKASGGWRTPYSYFALSPRWAEGENKKKTKYPVIFWLNPQEQQHVNFGWYTVEDLELWLQNKGPVPMANFDQLLKSFTKETLKA